MKNFILFIFISSLFIFSACEYEIIDSKPGQPINPISNLSHSISGSNLTLTWNLPSSYPEDIIQPISVMIRITRNGQNAGEQVLQGAPVSFIYNSYDPESTYKFIVKVKGAVNTEDRNFSNLRYSSGVTLEL
jgi:hypothetical protein